MHKEEWTTSGVPFYRSSDVMAAINGTENEKAYISEALYEKLSSISGKLEAGDVLVTGGGSVGKPYIVPNNEPLYTKDADLFKMLSKKMKSGWFRINGYVKQDIYAKDLVLNIRNVMKIPSKDMTVVDDAKEKRVEL